MNRIGVGPLESWHRGARGYADGGFVSDGPPIASGPIPMPSAATVSDAGPITIAPVYNMTVSGGGSPEETGAIVRAALAEHTKAIQRALPAWVRAARGRGSL